MKWSDKIPWEPARFSTPTIFDAAQKAKLEPRAIGGLRPLAAPEQTIAGFATTILARRRERRKRTVEEIRADIGALAAALTRGSIVVWSVVGDGPRFSSFGGMLGRIMQHRGVHGVVLEGWFRDVEEIASFGIDVWSLGNTPASGSGCFEMSFGVTVEVGGARISQGDLLFGDASGLTVLPSDADLSLVAEKAKDVEAREGRFRETLERTQDLEQALDTLTHI